MLAKLKQLITHFNQVNTQASGIDFNTALAAILIEVMRADGEVKPQELTKIKTLLISHCELNESDVVGIIEQTNVLVDNAIDLHGFVKELNKHTDSSERIEIVELLWHVAYADGVLDDHEEHEIRKICGVLYVTHNDFIGAKLRVQRALGIS
jgi:uncharacterized tellurite resistance protein B-like protein